MADSQKYKIPKLQYSKSISKCLIAKSYEFIILQLSLPILQFLPKGC